MAQNGPAGGPTFHDPIQVSVDTGSSETLVGDEFAGAMITALDPIGRYDDAIDLEFGRNIVGLEHAPNVGPPGSYTPPFAAQQTDLDRVRWLAGIAQHGFGTPITVVENPHGRPPGYAFRFHGEVGETFSQLWVGSNHRRVASFLTGLSIGRSLAQRSNWP